MIIIETKVTRALKYLYHAIISLVAESYRPD